MRKLLSLFLIVSMTLCLFPFSSLAETLQDCHRVQLSYTDTSNSNGSETRLYTMQSALPQVDEEINGIARKYEEKYGNDLPAAGNKTSNSSRLDVEIRYSRTGLTFLSFMVQARRTFHRELTEQEFSTRTYDMTNGQIIYLTDIFPENSYGWNVLKDNITQQVTAYFGTKEPDPDALKDALENVKTAEFTLHGMSLVLHYPADKFYPGKHTLLDVTIMYPDLWDYMSEWGFRETNNTAYYNTCALTFDDGPSGSNTPLVLKSLMKTGSVATSFVIGNRVEDFQYLVQREHDEGHSIGTHNWHHGNVKKSSVAALQAMPAKCNRVMNAAIGMTSKYDRVPSGLYHQMIKARAGWPLIQWSLDTYDWRDIPTAKVLARVKDQISDGDIILCHDIKDNTPQSTEEICSFLAENGYIMLTIDELFAKDGIELEPNKVYFRNDSGDVSDKR